MTHIEAIEGCPTYRQDALYGDRMTDRDLFEGAKQIAETLHGPGGFIPLARVVARHLGWFDLARDRGLTWDQMIRVLHVAGVRQPNGLPLSRGVVSSAVWRARERSAASKGGAGQPPKEKERWPRRVPPANRDGHRTAEQSLGRKEMQSARLLPSPAPSQSGSPQALEFMRRAAQLRNRSGDRTEDGDGKEAD